MKNILRFPKWFICGMFAIMSIIIEQQINSQTSANIVIELTQGDQPMVVVTPGQIIHWVTDANKNTAVQGIIFEHNSPCSNSAQSIQRIGDCTIANASNAPSTYKYDFCPDRQTQGDTIECQPQYGNLRISSQGQETTPASEVWLVLDKFGGIHNIFHPGDRANWYDKNGNPVNIKITSRTPNKASICTNETALGSPISFCNVDRNAPDSDFSYLCIDGMCTDPTAHVRSVGTGSPLVGLLGEIRIKVWLIYLMSGMSLGFLGFAGHRLWRRFFIKR